MKAKLLMTTIIFGVLILGCATAQAGTIKAQDDDIDFALTLVNGVLVPKTQGELAAGDVLVSIFDIQTLTFNLANVIPAGYEVTGIAVIQIDLDYDGGEVIPFTPYAGGFNAISPVDVLNGGEGEGAVLAMWMNSTRDFDLELEYGTELGDAVNCNSFASCLAAASAGTLLQVDGFAGDPDEYWTAELREGFGGNDIDIVQDTGGATRVASFDAALTTFYNTIGGQTILWQSLGGKPCPTGSFGLDGCVQGPTLTGNILGGDGLNNGIVANGAFARSDLDAQKYAVPEPSTLMLLGAGFLGLAVALRRRQK